MVTHISPFSHLHPPIFTTIESMYYNFFVLLLLIAVIIIHTSTNNIPSFWMQNHHKKPYLATNPFNSYRLLTPGNEPYPCFHYSDQEHLSSDYLYNTEV